MSEWTIDCGCTTTSMRSYGMPNRWWASMSSRPLFISVAESMVILPPIAHVGCLSACSTVTSSSSPRVRPRNGPPLAVSTSLSTVPGASPASSWCSAECSESTGMSAAPVASASAVTSSPPTTSDSLLASARSMPSPSVATVGPSPAEPTSALRTSSAPEPTTISTRPCAPTSTSPSVHASAARAPASASASAIRCTPKRRACSTSASQELSALSPTSSRSPDLSTMSRAWVPIEPVDPRTRRRRGTLLGCQTSRGGRRGLLLPRVRGVVGDESRDQLRVVPHRRVAHAGQRAELDAGDLRAEALSVAIDGQDPVAVAPGDERRAGDAVEVGHQARARADGPEDVVDDRAADRGLHELDRLLGGHLVAARHDVAQEQLAQAGPAHQARHLAHGPLGELLVAREPLDDALALSAVVVRPAAARRDRHDAARAPALGHLERQRAAHRVAGEVRLLDAQRVEERLEVVARLDERLRALRRRRATVVAVQRGRDDLEARDEVGNDRQPTAPGRGEAVHQHQRLAGTGAIQRRRALTHATRIRAEPPPEPRPRRDPSVRRSMLQTPERWRTCSHERQPDVITRHRGEEDGVEAVQRAAVSAEQAPRVLHAPIALEIGLEEVAQRRRDPDREAEVERVDPVEPVLV